MAHQNGLAVAKLHRLGLIQLVDADHLPVVAFPEDCVEGAEQNFDVIFLRLDITWRVWRYYIFGKANPVINATLQSHLSVVPIRLFLVLSIEKLPYAINPRPLLRHPLLKLGLQFSHLW